MSGIASVFPWQSLSFTIADGVATVTLARAEVHNAFDTTMIDELTRLFALLGVADEVRVILLTGAGASFSAGADIAGMRASLDLSAEQNQAAAEQLALLFATIDQCPRPTIARVNGAALGGGAGLVAVCDLAIAAEDAIFGFTETRLGIAPAVISPYVVRKIGEGQARALFLTATRFSAARAQAIGLVHQVTTRDDLDRAVAEAVAQIRQTGPVAVAATKELLRRLRDLDVESARQTTTALIARLRTSPEGQEGLRAFLDRRAPSWALGESTGVSDENE